jgi:hypothetical protein
MQSIAVAGICPAGCAAHHQSSPVGGRNRHLHPKLIGLLRFAFSDGVNPWDWTTCDKEFKPLAGQVVIQTVLAIHNPRRSASAGDSQRLCKRPVSQMELRWQSVDKRSGRCTKNLRPLAMSLDFGSIATKSPWLSALTWMKGVFARQQRLAQRPLDLIEYDLITWRRLVSLRYGCAPLFPKQQYRGSWPDLSPSGIE